MKSDTMTIRGPRPHARIMSCELLRMTYDLRLSNSLVYLKGLLLTGDFVFHIFVFRVRTRYQVSDIDGENDGRYHVVGSC
jgi:hypothetical protein